MCGRYNIGDAEQIMELRQILEEINKRYIYTVPDVKNLSNREIFPNSLAPVLIGPEPADARLMRWGFESPYGKKLIINARQETADTKKTFKESLQQRRCAIVAGGFYEWKSGPLKGRKEKYIFTRENGELLYMAGIYTPVHNDPVELVRSRFVIFTTKAQGVISEIHDRMPVLLDKDEMREYVTNPNAYKALFTKEMPTLAMKPVGNYQLSFI